MGISVKTITLEGRTVPIEGSTTDPYFQSIEAFAAQTAPLCRFVAKHVDDGLIIDVGANIGLTAMAMSFAAPRSHIIAFEPSPENVALFESNTRGQTRIELKRCGLADCAGDLDFLVPLAGANCHVVTPNYEFSSSVGFRPLKVPVTTLDSYLEETMPNERVVLIKIDVEGFEPNVLAGARRVIQRQRPLIWMEFNSVTLNIARDTARWHLRPRFSPASKSCGWTMTEPLSLCPAPVLWSTTTSRRMAASKTSSCVRDRTSPYPTSSR